LRAYLTPQAEADLEEIGDYIALDKSLGESVVGNWGSLEEPVWKWPDR